MQGVKRIPSRYLVALAIVLLFTGATVAAVSWIQATDGSKQSELSAAVLGGILVGVGVIVIERRFENRERRREHTNLLASGKNLADVDLTESRLDQAVARKVVMPRARLARAHLRGAAFDWSRLSKADLRGVEATAASFGSCYLDEAILVSGNFRRASFQNANMYHANCAHADFRDAQLGGAHLNLADLTDVDFRGARFVVRPAGAPFVSASLRSAYLYGADFRDALLVVRDNDPKNGNEVVGVDLTDAKANEETRWPTGFDPEAAGVCLLAGSSREMPGPAWKDPGSVDVTTNPSHTSWTVRHYDPNRWEEHLQDE